MWNIDATFRKEDDRDIADRQAEDKIRPDAKAALRHKHYAEPAIRSKPMGDTGNKTTGAGRGKTETGKLLRRKLLCRKAERGPKQKDQEGDAGAA